MDFSKLFQGVENITKRIQKINFQIPNISKIQSSDAIKEQNEWERHDEIMRAHQDNAFYSKIIVILTLISIILAVLALINK